MADRVRNILRAFHGATASLAGRMGFVPAPAAGDESKMLRGDGTWATPSGGNDPRIFTAVKSADESVTSSTTTQNDDHLALTVHANKVFTAVYYLNITCAAWTGSAGAIKCEWTYASGTTFYAGFVNDLSSEGGVIQTGTLLSACHYAATSADIIVVTGTWGGSDGTLQLKWAQRGSSGTATTVRKGSSVVVWELA